jgi:hypothetical protein
MLPPFLNGCAVFATKHALALAHASGGGKCKRRVPYPKCNGGRRRRSAQAQRGRLGCLLSRARGRASQQVRFPCLARSARRCFCFRGRTRREGEETATEFLRRVGRPEEAAEAAVWLCGDAVSYVTGQSMVVDGGLTVGRDESFVLPVFENAYSRQ